jgi:hypothetical protein
MFEGLRLENVDIFYSHLEYLGAFGISYDHLVHLVFIWYIFPVFGIMQQINLATLLTTMYVQKVNRRLR